VPGALQVAPPLPQGVKPCYDTVVALSDVLGSGLEAFRALAGRAGTVGRHMQSLLILRRRTTSHRDPAAIGRSPAGETHARIARMKFDIGSPAIPFGGEPGELPAIYGRDRIVLLPRDPWWVYAYWEITPATRAEAMRTLGVDADAAPLVLRIHDLTADAQVADQRDPWIDVEISVDVGSQYMNVGRPGVTVSAELGLCTRAGRFAPLVRSNTLQVPPSQASPDGTVSWLPMRIPSARSAASRPRAAHDALPTAATPPALRSGDAGVRH
jgi:hypothetical protein